jgi:hypothetical protein
MDTLIAIIRNMTSQGNEVKVFDWHKAAKLILKHQPKIARAGLSEDWDWTGGEIWQDGKPVPEEDTYTFLASTHATPELVLDDKSELLRYAK